MVSYKSSPARVVSNIILLFVFGALVVSASPLSSSDSLKSKRQSTTGTTSTGDLKPCKFVGNQDIYGLGIRIGLYAQWLSTYISNWLHNKKLTNMRDINTCFQLAMLTALMAMANQKPDPHVIDPLILIIQIIGSASTITNKATHRSEWKGTSWGGMIRFFVYWAVSIYACWFWFMGLERFAVPRVADSPNEACIPIGFAFSKQNIMTGWFRAVNKAAACVFALIYTVLFGYSAYNFGPEYVRNTRSKISTVYHSIPRQAEKSLGDVVDEAAKEVDERLNKWTPALCIILLFTAAAAAECIIVWNEVTGVNDMFSTGQLIPLVVGVGGLIQVIYKLMNQENRVHYIHRNPGSGRASVPIRMVYPLAPSGHGSAVY